MERPLMFKLRVVQLDVVLQVVLTTLTKICKLYADPFGKMRLGPTVSTVDPCNPTGGLKGPVITRQLQRDTNHQPLGHVLRNRQIRSGDTDIVHLPLDGTLFRLNFRGGLNRHTVLAQDTHLLPPTVATLAVLWSTLLDFIQIAEKGINDDRIEGCTALLLD